MTMTCLVCHTPNDNALPYCTGCGGNLAMQMPAGGQGNGVGPNGLSQHAFQGVSQAVGPTGDGPGQRGASADDPGQAETITSPGTARIGTIIEGKYRLDATIGVGGMGTVFRAARLVIGDEVAIKVLRPESVADPAARERFTREARAAARIKHENVVSVFDFGVTKDGLAYLVMELVHGESLREIIKRKRWLTPRESVEILDQICVALDEAHRNQVVHRDLKPDNIMVRPGKRLRVKVVDFGIAKLRDLPGNDLTVTGAQMGTPYYMSPEQCRGESIDHRSDIYSLGIVLYEMLTGVVPFRKPSRYEVWVEHSRQPPPPLRTVNGDISSKVEAVVLQALAKDPEHRPQGALTLADVFREASEEEIPLPPQPQPQPQPPSPEPPSTWTTIVLIGIAAVGLLAIGALIAVLLYSGPKPLTNSDRGGSPPVTQPSVVVTDPSPAPGPASPTPVPTPVGEVPTLNREYVGKIDHTVDFSISFHRLEGGRLEGTAITPGDTDKVVGKLYGNGEFDLDATNEVTKAKGRYKGRIRDGRITGTWTGERHKDPVGFWANPR